MHCDLHIHSLESDGKLTPREVVDAAIANGVEAAVLCDHDTTAGCAEFIAYGKSRGLVALAGVEMSAKWHGGNCHILGLNVDIAHEKLQQVLTHTRESRMKRNIVILKKLAQLGMEITPEELLNESGGDVIARPHIAYALMRRGYVSSLQEAFDKFLSNGRVAYTDRFRLSPAECVRLLRSAGAFVVLAHPRQLKISNELLLNFLADLKREGLQGIEIYAPDTSDEQIAAYKNMAESLSLVETGGSDFHAIGLGGRDIGYYRDGVKIPEIDLEKIIFLKRYILYY